MQFEACESRIALDGALGEFVGTFSVLPSTQVTDGGIIFTFDSGGPSPRSGLVVDSSSLINFSHLVDGIDFNGKDSPPINLPTDALGFNQNLGNLDRVTVSPNSVEELRLIQQEERIDRLGELPSITIAEQSELAENTPETISLAALLAEVPNSDVVLSPARLARPPALLVGPPAAHLVEKRAPSISVENAARTEYLSTNVESLARAWAFEIATVEPLSSAAAPLPAEPELTPHEDLFDRSTTNERPPVRARLLEVSHFNEAITAKPSAPASMPIRTTAVDREDSAIDSAFSALEEWQRPSERPFWSSPSYGLTAGSLALLAIERVRQGSSKPNQTVVGKKDVATKRACFTE